MCSRSAHQEEGPLSPATGRAGLADEVCSLGVSRIFSQPPDFGEGWCAPRDRGNGGTSYHRPTEPGREQSELSSFSHASEASEASDRPNRGRSQRAIGLTASEANGQRSRLPLSHASDTSDRHYRERSEQQA